RLAVPLRPHRLGALARAALAIAARGARARAEDEGERADVRPVGVRDRDREVQGALEPQPLDPEAVEPLHGVAQGRGGFRVEEDQPRAGRLETYPVPRSGEEVPEEVALGEEGGRRAE